MATDKGPNITGKSGDQRLTLVHCSAQREHFLWSKLGGFRDKKTAQLSREMDECKPW